MLKKLFSGLLELVVITIVVGGFTSVYVYILLDEPRVYFNRTTGQAIKCEVVVNGHLEKHDATWYYAHKEDFNWVKYPNDNP